MRHHTYVHGVVREQVNLTVCETVFDEFDAHTIPHVVISGDHHPKSFP